jgi:phosphatidylglycerophosphate synthase
MWGKLSTLLQIAASLAVLSECAYGISRDVVDAVLYATAAATIWSGLHYLLRAIASMKYVAR